MARRGSTSASFKTPFTLGLGIAGIVLFLLFAGGPIAGKAPAANAEPPPGRGDTREIDHATRNIGPDRVRLAGENGNVPRGRGSQNRPPQLGDQRTFLALDDEQGFYYLKTFTLRAATAGRGPGSEAWVADDLNFPVGDCRNDGVRNVITNQQLRYLIQQFDSNIRPTDVDWFGEPLKRTGQGALINDLLGLHQNSYVNNQGRDIILIDNVRDANYYDMDNANSFSYIAGFFTTAMPFYFNRNVITIDAWDWVHRTGANPPHAPSADPCTSAPARPFLYEGVFAHEYQHLIHSDYDPDEVNWVNEGMSDLAEILTGYSDPALHVDEKGHDGHTQNFLGWSAVLHPDWNPIPRPSGPENSLTVWGDQGDDEILGDYGHAYAFMTYLQSQGYDQNFFTTWAHEPANGIDGLNATLSGVGSSDSFDSLFTDLAVSVVADAFLDSGAGVSGETAADIQHSILNATVHFTGDAYDSLGAPPWGSDYVPLGPGASLTSVAFNGDQQFAPPPGPQWVVEGGYYAVVGGGANYPDNADLSITHDATITGAGLLTFNHYYDIEETWDFGFVQVSDDGGATWTSIACTGTTTVHDPAADPAIVAQLPGYSGVVGTAGAPVAASCDLSAYSGQNIVIAFRFMSDAAVGQKGWFVKDVQLDGVDVGTPGSLAGWNNQGNLNPAELGFIVQLIGLTGTVDAYGRATSAGNVVVVRATLDANNDYTFSAGDLAALAGSGQVVAVVSGIPEDEGNGIYGPYSLLVNGAERADGTGVVNPW